MLIIYNSLSYVSQIPHLSLTDDDTRYEYSHHDDIGIGT
jgi:hypothetical protein